MNIFRNMCNYRQNELLLIGVLLLMFARASLAQPQAIITDFPVVVAEALKQAGIPKQSVSLYVQAVEASAPILNHNADKTMNPASVMKLITTYAALDLLMPTYRWKTEIYRDGNLSNGVLDGNLYIKAFGDPSFKAQEFWRLLMTLQQFGIQDIKGDLIVDKSYFDKNVGNKKTFDTETWRAYNAEPSAFLVGGRSTSFKFTASDTAVNISQEFELTEIQVVNNMKLVAGACGDWRSRFGYMVKPNANGAIVTFSGAFSPDCGERYLELSVLDDEKYAFYTFKKLIAQLGIKFKGTFKVKDTPADAIKLFEQVSEPLGYIVRDINKWSNNLMARQLLLTIAAEKNSAPATESKGAETINRWLISKGLIFNELVIENGSGLSRIERVSAAHLGQLLMNAYVSAAMPEFMASLPILALDGTIKKRLNDSPSATRAHLKTGSIEGVNAIAGYVLDANNHRHVLVMLVNHPKAAASKNAQDALIEWVHQQP